MKSKLRITLATDQNEKFYGPGVQDLLYGIQEYGSVKEACEKMSLSYSKGRRILKHAEAALGYPLVVRQQGGALGGSARITPEAADFMERYRKLADAVAEYTKEQLKQLF